MGGVAEFPLDDRALTLEEARLARPSVLGGPHGFRANVCGYFFGPLRAGKGAAEADLRAMMADALAAKESGALSTWVASQSGY